ncbi:IS200/IS605 family transposase [Frankia sp. EAN1pec]|uniref:IS200/IS605 family transposase n=1 Tax=Parafrankia sp. (strain EAN1pec) TaxID=298653 RepID=UPI00059BEFC5
MVRRVAVGVGGVYGRGYRRVRCSKFRRPVLAGPVGDRCGELVREKCAEYEWMVVAWEVTPDPVDLFVKVHLRHFPSCVADQLAGLTSRVLREGFGHLRFWLPALWPRLYVAATVGGVSTDTARRYVDTGYGRLWSVERAR